MQDDRSVSRDKELFFCAHEEQNPPPVPRTHFVSGHPLEPPFPEGMQRALFGMGCFWGAEKKFWQKSGVFTTAVGYAAGVTSNPTYREVCSGRTGHSEVVLIVFDPAAVSYDELLKTFWENHDPTQGMRQGNDVGTQYRSGIYYYDEEQRKAAEAYFSIGELYTSTKNWAEVIRHYTDYLAKYGRKGGKE